MPCLDTDLYRNVHIHTTEAYAHGYTHACIDTLARVYVYTLLSGHTPLQTRTQTHILTRAHTQTHTLRPTKRQVCTSAAWSPWPMILSNNNGFTWSNHKKTNVSNSRGSPPVSVRMFWHHVLFESCRTGEHFQSLAQYHVSVCVSFTAALSSVHGGSRRTKMPLTQKVNNQTQKTNQELAKQISSPQKREGSPLRWQKECASEFILGSEIAPL